MPPDHVYNVVPYGHSLEIARIISYIPAALAQRLHTHSLRLQSRNACANTTRSLLV